MTLRVISCASWIALTQPKKRSTNYTKNTKRGEALIVRL